MMKAIFRYLFVLSIAGFLTNCSVEKNDYIPQKGPYLQNVTRSGITIMWESSKAYKGSLEYGKTESLDQIINDLDTVNLHKFDLTGLDIEYKYYYRITNNENSSSPIYTFHTAIKKDTPFSFIAYGDNKNGPFNHEKIANLVLKKRPDFVIHNGDLVDRGGVLKQWDRLFFTPIRNLIREVPIFTVIGNHEDNHPNYYHFFTFPNTKQYYSFDYGNAHFIILDSDSDFMNEESDQLKWLKDDLEKNNAIWTIVFQHVPPFTSGGGYFSRGRITLKNLEHSIFEKYGVDLVLSGDDHDYERTFPIVTKNGTKPITYIVCGNGGTPMRYVGKREWTAYSERVFGFVKIDIDGNRLKLQSININNKVIDEFTLDKNDPQSLAAYTKDKIYFEDIKDPDKAAKYYSKGKKAHKKDDYEEAIELLKQAFEYDNTCAEAVGRMSDCYYEMGKYEEAIKYAKKSIEILPVLPYGYNTMVKVKMAQKKYDEALEWAQKMNDISSDSPDATQKMAEIYFKQKQYELAFSTMQKAINILPNDAELYFDFGEMLEESGQKEKALQVYKKGLDWYMKPEEDDDYKKITEKVKIWESKLNKDFENESSIEIIAGMEKEFFDGSFMVLYACNSLYIVEGETEHTQFIEGALEFPIFSSNRKLSRTFGQIIRGKIIWLPRTLLIVI